MKKREIVRFFLFVLLFVAGGSPVFSGTDDRAPVTARCPTVTIGESVISVTIARTLAERTLGLSEYKNLPADSGMLFILPVVKKQRVWMRDMMMPIDILWINGDRLVGYVDEVQPQPGVAEGELTMYSSPQPVQYILEVGAGLRALRGWQPGDEVRICFDEPESLK